MLSCHGLRVKLVLFGEAQKYMWIFFLTAVLQQVSKAARN